jgi:hypothetical protein
MGTLLYPPLVIVPGLAVLGILDVYPPLWVYALLGAGLAGIAFFTLKGEPYLRRVNATLVFILVMGFAAVSMAIYCICTPPGMDWIGGLQSRYYLPLVPFILLLLRRQRPAREDTDQQSQAISFLDRQRGRLLAVAGMVFLAGVLYTPWEAAHGFYNLGLVSALRATGLW